jgi:hypothetical protein
MILKNIRSAINLAAQKDPRALPIISAENTFERLKYSVSLLETIHKGLSNYLEIKRLFFPRYISYFLFKSSNIVVIFKNYF